MVWYGLLAGDDGGGGDEGDSEDGERGPYNACWPVGMLGEMMEITNMET